MKTVSLLENQSDEALIQTYQKSHDLEVLGILFKRYASDIKNLCLKYLKEEASSEDALMDIFELLADKLKTNQVKTFKSWIYCVTRNFCFKRFRNKTYFQPVDALSDCLCDEEETPKQLPIHALGQAINRLKVQQRVCIELFYFQKLSYAEIAEQVKYDIKKVKSHIQNGKLQLKKMILAA
ncbi:MAG: sigma-70 family RNA polymerase sigma factor [Saprospiraceae bacterium]